MTMTEALLSAEVDMETTLHRFGENRTLLARFIRKFPGDATYAELSEGMAHAHFDQVERAAHTLKGTSANLGFQELSNRCAALVTAIRAGNAAETGPLFQRVSQEYDMIIALIARIEWEMG